MAEEYRDIVLIGAGLAGLAAGIALAQTGLAVTVVEVSKGRTADHWGYTLWPTATKSLEEIGLLPETVAAGCQLKIFRWLKAGGDEWLSIQLAGLAAKPFVGILPSKLAEVLHRRAVSSGVELLNEVDEWRCEQQRGGMLRLVVNRQAGRTVFRCQLLIGADGPESAVRAQQGIRIRRWRPTKQAIVTGIGGPMEERESWQTFGDGWSSGVVALDADHSWHYRVVRTDAARQAERELRAETGTKRRTNGSLNRESALTIQPWSIRTETWHAPNVLLIGDAAHAILPHLGLGGTMALEDLPVLVEVARAACRRGGSNGAGLSDFRHRRGKRVSFAQRVSELWAFSMTSRLPGVTALRDLNFARLARCPSYVEAFLREVASPEPVRLRTRLQMWLP